MVRINNIPREFLLGYALGDGLVGLKWVSPRT